MIYSTPRISFAISVCFFTCSASVPRMKEISIGLEKFLISYLIHQTACDIRRYWISKCSCFQAKLLYCCYCVLNKRWDCEVFHCQIQIRMYENTQQGQGARNPSAIPVDVRYQQVVNDNYSSWSYSGSLVSRQMKEGFQEILVSFVIRETFSACK